VGEGCAHGEGCGGLGCVGVAVLASLWVLCLCSWGLLCSSAFVGLMCSAAVFRLLATDTTSARV
jgi:hypothetical protein